ncbi:MAG: DUF1640 domain-containing protein [Chloroflexi bacterium]|jgi:hypothetical protein|nr:DUF1640 domain-containing protein [Candidatus Neomarinimicrobiota bacterium]MBT6012655.1 DUF1640 domain-containing protein [Candidatus Neomarinimicrobiota bacterium]MBT7080161.1 DUF1640 domain-containing protein [Chloroflexota bacterium]
MTTTIFRLMTTMTFDTHQLIQELCEADFTEKQAETVVRILAKSQEQLVSKEHFDNRLEATEHRIKADIIKWTVGLLLAQTALLLTILPKIS